MRTVIITLLVAYSMDVSASNDDLVVLSVLPAAFFSGVSIHEGSHALAATALGVDVVGVNPYPTQHRGQNYFGMTRLQWPDDVDRRVVVAEKLAPYFTDILMFASVDLLLTFFPKVTDSIGGALLYVFGMVTPFVDFVYNLYNPDVTCDFGMAATYSRQHRALFYAIGSIVVVTALWRVVTTGVRVFRR